MNEAQAILDWLETGLLGLGVSVITIAFVIYGFKIAHGTPWQQCVTGFVGAIIVASASTVASYMIGG